MRSFEEFDQYVFFWRGPFSQWAKSPFILDDREFVTAEQWMMYNKAVMFGDQETKQKIMETSSPKEQKALGQRVKGFDDAQWMEKAYDVVVRGNLAKYVQNNLFYQLLEGTRGTLLVEASPYDRRWGIGFKEGDPQCLVPELWGENLLGKALTEVRIQLIGG